MQVLNYLYLLILTFIEGKYLYSKGARFKLPFSKTRKAWFDGPETFWVILFSTGLIALSASGALDLMALRLLVLEIFCILAMLASKHRIIWSFPLVLYAIYLIWLVIGCFYSPSPGYGVRVIMKYIYILLIPLAASCIVRDGVVAVKSGLWARTVGVICLIVIFVPGLSSVFPVFWYGTAVAINNICTVVFSLALYYFYKGNMRKKNLIYAFLFILPCILWVFRTSIMGTTLALMVFFFFRYKLKSLPVIFGVFILFIVAIFTIPSVKEKMFKTEGMEMADLQTGKISQDDIDSNGRFAMWEWSLANFYDKDKVYGAGTGNLQEVFYSLKHPFGLLKICHNDYVQILCDNGLIGIILFGGSFLFIIGHCFVVYNRKRCDKYIKICAITAGSSAAGMLLCMYTDNVINYSMSTLSFPMGFYGMMLGLVAQAKKQKRVVRDISHSMEIESHTETTGNNRKF